MSVTPVTRLPRSAFRRFVRGFLVLLAAVGATAAALSFLTACKSSGHH